MLKRIILLSLFVALSTALFAQEERVSSNSLFKSRKDSILNTKLNSSYFNDSLNRIRLFAWTIDTYTNIPIRAILDTGQRQTQRNYPFYQHDNIGAVFLGNIGGAAVDLDYFKIEAKTPFFYQNVYQHFVGTPENTKFYNTKVPYSNVRYSTAGNRRTAEEIFGLTLAQNVNPALSFGINYNRWGTKGLYKNQRSKNKDFSGYVSFLGKKYTAYAGYVYNIADAKENGGIVDEKNVLDTTIKPEFLDFKIRNAENIIKSNTFFLSQTYSIPFSDADKFEQNGIYNGPQLLIGVYTKYSMYSRVYTDDTTGISQYKYYKNYYIDPAKSYDSTSLREFDNRAYIQLRPYTNNSLLSLIGGGIGYQHLKYYVFNINDYLFGNSSIKHYNVYGYANAEGNFRRYIDWKAFGKLGLAGYNAGDILAKGTVAFSVYPWDREVKLVGNIKFQTQTPDFYLQDYFSNHFKWSNNFDRIVDTRIEVKLDVPFINMEVGVRQGIVKNYIYFDIDAMPKQYSDVISVTSAYLQKNLALGQFHLDGKVLFQKSSKDEVLPLPAVAANVGVYYQFNVVKNVLKSQFGFDLNYNSAYYTYDYNPAVGQFHLQNTRKVGNYPWLDLFANFKWKRAAIFVKVRNIGKDFVGNNDYFSALGYPRVPLQIQYGLSWSFYD